jgi:hypothetical protein
MAGRPAELHEAEKTLTRRSDDLARQRQELPWVRIDKDYRFQTDEAGSLKPRAAGVPRERPCSIAAASGCTLWPPPGRTRLPEDPRSNEGEYHEGAECSIGSVSTDLSIYQYQRAYRRISRDDHGQRKSRSATDAPESERTER